MGSIFMAYQLEQEQISNCMSSCYFGALLHMHACSVCSPFMSILPTLHGWHLQCAREAASNSFERDIRVLVMLCPARD